MNNYSIVTGLQNKVRLGEIEYGRASFNGHVIEVTFDPDTQYVYRWDGEVVTEGKLLELLAPNRVTHTESTEQGGQSQTTTTAAHVEHERKPSPC